MSTRFFDCGEGVVVSGDDGTATPMLKLATLSALDLRYLRYPRSILTLSNLRLIYMSRALEHAGRAAAGASQMG